MLPVTNLKVDKSCCEKSICSETSLIAQLECDATDGREVLHMVRFPGMLFTRTTDHLYQGPE